jgi:4-hydroxybenzoate polyprenyltransferase
MSNNPGPFKTSVDAASPLARGGGAVVSGVTLGAVLRALRPHHWVKNLLLFVPFLLAHHLEDWATWITLATAFASFSFVASGMYIANDLMDIEADRLHPTKQSRPLATGGLPISVGVGMAIVALGGGLLIGWEAVSARFAGMVMLYAVLSAAYSGYLKRVPILDILILAGLYAHRLLAGSVASETTLSPWLVTFAIFFFLSLAMLKRYVELTQSMDTRVGRAGGLTHMGRGYLPSDREMLRIMGPCTGYLAVVVLGLYLSDDRVTLLYHRPEVLWTVAPLLVYWVTRVWFMANRGAVDDDPIVFAIRDWPSYLVGSLAVAVIVYAAL